MVYNSNYFISTSNDVWDITEETAGNGSIAVVDRGRAFHAGNSTASVTLATLAPGSEIGQHQGSNQIEVSGSITGAVDAGSFASMTAGSYVMKRVTTTLAGVSNTFLRSGAADTSSRRSIHKLETVRTHKIATALRAGQWSIVSGVFSAALATSEDANTPSANNEFNAFDQQAGRGATSGTLDSAANPSQATPGELIMHHGSGLPLNTDYQPRTTW